MKTNACRLLDSLGIHYTLREYPVDLDDLSGTTVAAKIGLPPEQVYKTLVTRTDAHEILFAVLAVSDELDLKKLAAAARSAGIAARKADLVPVKEVQDLTGYVRGGVTVFAGKKPYPVFVDELIELFDEISVSAGVRGTQIVLSPADYIRAAEATVAPLTKDQAREQDPA